MADLGLPTHGLPFYCSVLPVTLTVGELEARSQSLAVAVKTAPTDLCAGNQFRESIRYRYLRNGQFGVKLSSLPPDLAGIAKDSDALPTEEGNNSKISPDELEPAKLFRALASSDRTDGPETELQLGLSYVDLMIRQGGRENKARLSSRSIEALSSVLDRRPYMIAALYARGLNYLYWPVIAGKLPFAIRDLKLCIALSRLPEMEKNPPLIIAEAYQALGDAYVKLADSTPSKDAERRLLTAGRHWWAEGRRRFPMYHGFDKRIGLPTEELVTYIDSARGLETYINSDLELLWTR